MASYVVLERRSETGSRPDTVFVRDNFSVLALVFPLIWLLWHRLWFAAIMLLLVSVGIGLIGEYLAPGAAMVVAGLVVSVFVALEGPAWRLAQYGRRGFREQATIIAPDLEEAEIRWFAGRGAPRRPAEIERRPAGTPPPLPASEHSDMLFGFQGGR